MLTMKDIFKIIFILILMFTITGVSYAKESINAQLDRIENSLWGFDYKQEDEVKRLDRIEQEVYGEINSKESPQLRVDKINKVLGLELSDEENEIVKKQIDDIQSAGVSYPKVTAMELEVFGKTYEKEGIYRRLERLEKKVFMAVQQGDLNQRFERLESNIQLKSAHASSKSQTQYEYQYPNYNQNDKYDRDDIYLQLSGLENGVFRKTYNYDPMSVRLSRLERKIFQRDFASDDDWTRIQRIQAASTAKKTAKYYDSNKVQKFTSTGLQIGTFILMILACIL